MNYKDYPEYLIHEDLYETPADKLGSPFLSGLKFYANCLRIVLYSNYHAKRKIYNRYNWVASSLDILHSIERAGVKVKVEGIKNISSFEGPAVFASNHMSTLETFLFPSFIQPQKPVVYVIKKELATYPLFGPIASARHPIIVGRENPREDLQIVMNEGSQNLQMGRSVIIFPQKTRSYFFKPNEFNSLGIKLAKRNNVPVIPTAIYTKAWGTGKLIKDFGKIDPKEPVYLSFGKPISITGSGTEEHQQVINYISNKFKEWGKEDYIR